MADNDINDWQPDRNPFQSYSSQGAQPAMSDQEAMNRIPDAMSIGRLASLQMKNASSDPASYVQKLNDDYWNKKYDFGQMPIGQAGSAQAQGAKSPSVSTDTPMEQISRFAQESRPGQLIKGIIELPRSSANPYEGMSDAERYGRNIGEVLPMWDSTRDYGYKTWGILQKRWNGVEPTKEELDDQSKATDKVIIDAFTGAAAGKQLKFGGGVVKSLLTPVK